MNTSKFTKAELEDYIETLEEEVASLKSKLKDEKEGWEAIVDEKDNELEAMQSQFRAAFEEGFMLACTGPKGNPAMLIDRAWLTSQTRREHGVGE
jgi:hypothetical protein